MAALPLWLSRKAALQRTPFRNVWLFKVVLFMGKASRDLRSMIAPLKIMLLFRGKERTYFYRNTLELSN